MVYRNRTKNSQKSSEVKTIPKPSTADTQEQQKDEADEGEYVDPHAEVEMITMSPTAAASTGDDTDAVDDDYEDPNAEESKTTNSQPSPVVLTIPTASEAVIVDDHDDYYEQPNEDVIKEHGYINVERPPAHDDDGEADYEAIVTMEDTYENVNTSFA